MDVGGTAAGSMPITARCIYHEGMRMPAAQALRRGTLNEELLALFCHNTRVPKMVEADIKAIAAGTAAGAARVRSSCASASARTSTWRRATRSSTAPGGA